MANDILMIGWNRPTTGREMEAVEVFGTAMAFYEREKKAGRIESYQSFFLDQHGGDLNGFTVLFGDRAKLETLRSSEEFMTIVARCMTRVDGFGVITGVTGSEINRWMALYTSNIPRK